MVPPLGYVRGRWCGSLQGCCALFRQSTVTDVMSTLGHSSPIWTYRANAHKMRISHDDDRSNPKDMCSLSVVDLDLSLSPDAFGLQAFDNKKPLTRMLPGSNPCERRLMLPDSRLGTDRFHEVLIDDLATSPSWRSGHISPADVTSLRRRWPKAVFKTMQRRAQEVERLRRGALHRPDRAFRHSAPGVCPVCEVRIDSVLDVHMLNFHLELTQLWHCPVEWCAVWKCSVRGCLDHLMDKHGGSTFFALENVVNFFPPWTVTRDVWQMAVHPDVSGIAVDPRLFHEARCRLVHRYRVCKDPFPHSCVGGAAWPGTSRLLSRWRSVAGPAEFASCVIC